MKADDYFALEPVMAPVTSSNIKAVGFVEADGEGGLGTLAVEFSSGGVYRYAAVPREHYEALVAPGVSVGRTFAALIRSAPFASKQVRHALRVAKKEE